MLLSEEKTFGYIQKERIERLKAHLEKRKKIAWKSSYEQGIKNAQKIALPLKNKLQKIKEEMFHYKVDMIVNTAQFIIEKKTRENPQLLIEMVVKILKNISEHTDVEICAHSEDSHALSLCLSEIMRACSSARKITLFTDDKMSAGSILVKANKSIIDAQVSTQLLQVRNILCSLKKGDLEDGLFSKNESSP